MSRWDNLKYKYTQLSIAEKIIVINVICFVIPFVFNSVFYLFQIPTASFSRLGSAFSEFQHFYYPPLDFNHLQLSARRFLSFALEHDTPFLLRKINAKSFSR